MNLSGTPTSPADLRAAIAKSWRRPLYHLAAVINVHPVTLSRVLKERIPLRPELAARIIAVLRGEGGSGYG